MVDSKPPDRYEFEDGSFVEVGIVPVPQSEQYPSGIKYHFQYVGPDGVPLLRFDNAHGTHERHEGPNSPGIPVEYPGEVEEHLQRFFEEVDQIREE
jgi:hypothetical protein